MKKLDKAKPRVIVRRLSAIAGGGGRCSRDGAGGESHACVPERNTACRSVCKPRSLPIVDRHYGVQARIPGFWDSRVAEVETRDRSAVA